MIKKLKLEEIILDERIYPREVVSKQTIQQYMSALRQGATFPPVIVGLYRDKYYLVDGWHRFRAHRRIRRKEINVEIINCSTERDLYIEAVRRNFTHGRPFAEKEKEKIILKLKSMNIDVVDISKLTFVSKNNITNIITTQPINRAKLINTQRNGKTLFMVKERIKKFTKDIKKLETISIPIDDSCKQLLNNVKIEIDNILEKSK